MPTSAANRSTNNPAPGAASRCAGFTMMELAVVLALIALVLAVALPQFASTIVTGEHETAARRIAEYGREAMNYCLLAQHHLTVKIDLDAQEVWSLEWPAPVLEDDMDEETGGRTNAQTLSAYTAGAQMDEASVEALDRCRTFDEGLRRAKLTKAQRAYDLNQEEGMLDEIGPLFEKEFTLDDEDEYAPQEVIAPLLERFAVDPGIEIASVWFEGVEYAGGQVDIDISELGLASPVIFYVRNSDDDYYTVTWDPLRGEGTFESGKQEVL